MIRTTPVIITPPTNEPVTVAEAKAYARVDINEDDSLIAALIKDARVQAEKHLRRALITQTWKLVIDLPYNQLYDSLPAGKYDMPVSELYAHFPREFDLPYKPIQSISSIVTYDTSNTSSTYSADNYFLDDSNGRVVLNDTAVIPTTRQKAAMVITYVAGYGKSATVPEPIKTGIKMHVAKMYDSRLSCEIPKECMNKYDFYRVYG